MRTLKGIVPSGYIDVAACGVVQTVRVASVYK